MKLIILQTVQQVNNKIHLISLTHEGHRMCHCAGVKKLSMDSEKTDFNFPSRNASFSISLIKSESRLWANQARTDSIIETVNEAHRLLGLDEVQP